MILVSQLPFMPPPASLSGNLRGHALPQTYGWSLALNSAAGKPIEGAREGTSYNPLAAKWTQDLSGGSRYHSSNNTLPPSTLRSLPDALGPKREYGRVARNSELPYGHRPIRPELPATIRSTTPELSVYTAGNTEGGSVVGASEDLIAPYLQIPPTINNSKGSLAEFAAQITCLFWFESSFTLHRVEEAVASPTVLPLVPEAVPTMGFRKWVMTLLSTTQVSQNVILLALLFIYRLKKTTVTVKGKAGSEYRLMTVALMLGNKFLDDNTYTNKTWAEVSGISVAEIHVMEVEFLSNMKYNLFTSARDWDIWHRTLGRFWDYFDKASRGPSLLARANGPWCSPVRQLSMDMPLASPRSIPSISSPLSAAKQGHPTTGSQMGNVPTYSALGIPSPMPRIPAMDSRPVSRKRSYDDGSSVSQAKRRALDTLVHEHTPPLSVASTLSSRSNRATPNLPIPGSSINASGNLGPFAASYSGTLPAPFPLPSGRHVQSQHGHSGHPWPQDASILTPPQTMGPHMLPMIEQKPQFGSVISTSHASSPTPGDLSRSHLELSSPGGYPTQRTSPYNPVRGVSTLLVPPPSASLQNPSQHINEKQMHYQPLSKGPIERRTGTVPYIGSLFAGPGWDPSWLPQRWPRHIANPGHLHQQPLGPLQ